MESLEARSSRAEELLLGLIKCIHSILLKYEQDFKLVPNTPGAWNTPATESLIYRLKNLSQYVKACEELLRAARRYKVFSNIDVDFVGLQQGGKRVSMGVVVDSNEVIDASCTTETLSKVSNHYCHKSVSSTRESIKLKLSETSRLHAEVQLVLYYEQDDILLRPRVICSSKSVC